MGSVALVRTTEEAGAEVGDNKMCKLLVALLVLKVWLTYRSVRFRRPQQLLFLQKTKILNYNVGNNFELVRCYRKGESLKTPKFSHFQGFGK